MGKLTIGLYTGSLSGHRESYLNFASKILNGERVFIKDMFFKKNPVLFLMIEDSFFLFFIVSLYRTVFRWKTVGLLFRPKPAIEGKSFRLILKRVLLKFLKSIPNVSVLLIIPSNLNKEFEKISNGWIYDFQFWDVSDKDYELLINYKNNKKQYELVEQISLLANSKKVITAIGLQDYHKGFDIFLNEYLKNDKLRDKYLFAFGGKASLDFKDNIKSFEDKKGFALNRFITDDEILKLYASGDLIWVLYSEEYDQASGIFGRAIQFGIPVIVRKNSLVHKICENENISYIAIDKNQLDKLIALEIEEIDLLRGKRNRNKFKEESVNKLKNALGMNNNE